MWEHDVQPVSAFWVNPRFREFGAVFSSDGKWIAYTSNEEGQGLDIFVQPFPPTGERHLITRTEGAFPVWAEDQSALFYRKGTQPRDRLFGVSTFLNPGLRFGNERELPFRGILTFNDYRDYDLTPDGERFLVVIPAGQARSEAPPRTEIHIIQNWFEELKARVPLP